MIAYAETLISLAIYRQQLHPIADGLISSILYDKVATLRKTSAALTCLVSASQPMPRAGRIDGPLVLPHSHPPRRRHLQRTRLFRGHVRRVGTCLQPGAGVSVSGKLVSKQ